MELKEMDCLEMMIMEQCRLGSFLLLLDFILFHRQKLIFWEVRSLVVLGFIEDL